MLNTIIIEDVMSGTGKVDVATLRSLIDYLYRDVGGADRCALGHQGDHRKAVLALDIFGTGDRDGIGVVNVIDWLLAG